MQTEAQEVHSEYHGTLFTVRVAKHGTSSQSSCGVSILGDTQKVVLGNWLLVALCEQGGCQNDLEVPFCDSVQVKEERHWQVMIKKL